MSKEDKEKQITGFDTNSGHLGYLRASIGMVNENAVLRIVFPDEYWTGKKKFFAFSEEGYKFLHWVALRYLFAALKGEEIKLDNEGMKAQAEMGNNIKKMLSAFPMDKVEQSTSNEFRYAIMWINSLFSFYELGMEKQKEGLKPSIEISW